MMTSTKSVEKVKLDTSFKLMELTLSSCQRKLSELKSSELNNQTVSGNYLGKLEQGFKGGEKEQISGN